MSEVYAPPKSPAGLDVDAAPVAWWSRALAVLVGGMSAFSILGILSATYMCFLVDGPKGTLIMVAAYCGFCAFSWYLGARAFWTGSVNRWVWLFAPMALSVLGALIRYVGVMTSAG